MVADKYVLSNYEMDAPRPDREQSRSRTFTQHLGGKRMTDDLTNNSIIMDSYDYLVSLMKFLRIVFIIGALIIYDNFGLISFIK